MPIDQRHNAGRSTARAALETELYALRNGDVDLLASVIAFDPADESKISDLLSAVPAEIRMRLGTPERIVAFLVMGGQRMEAMKIVAETPPRDGVVVQQIRFKFENDPTIREDGVVAILGPGGWSTVFPTEQIKRMTDTLGRKSTNQVR